MDANTIIIGAGPAGLAAAASLKQHGIEAVVIESSGEIAHAWKTHYDRLRLNSIKQLSHLPHRRMPRSYPRYPSRQQVVDYFEDYAHHFGIAPRFNQRAEKIERTDAGWQVSTAQDVLSCSHLVIATGFNHAPVIPEIPGLANFRGGYQHSKAYRNGRAYAGRHVLVVGAGNSGTEIAVDLLEHGAKPTLVIRSPVHVTPRDLFGLIPAQVTSSLLGLLPLGLADRIAAWTLRLVVGDLSRYGIRRPTKGPIRALVEDARVAMFDTGIVKLIKQGKIPVRPNIVSIEGDRVCFEDGASEVFDHIVFATGYRPQLSELLGPLATEYLDDRGWPRDYGKDLGHGLYFVGFQESPRGMLNDMSRHARRMAQSIAA